MRCKFWTVVLIGLLLLPSMTASAGPANEAVKKGKVCFDKGDYDGAVAAYAEAIKLIPEVRRRMRIEAVHTPEKGRSIRLLQIATKRSGLTPTQPWLTGSGDRFTGSGGSLRTPLPIAQKQFDSSPTVPKRITIEARATDKRAT